MKLTNHLRRHYFSITGGPNPEIHSNCSTRYNNYSTITKTINQSPQSKFKCTISILSLGYFTWLTFCWSRVVREEQKTKRVVRIKSHNTISHISSYIYWSQHSLSFPSICFSLSLSPCGSLCLWFVICSHFIGREMQKRYHYPLLRLLRQGHINCKTNDFYV